MNKNRFTLYYVLSCLGILIASLYPLYMGVRVVTDLIINGTVLKENYPKYIIPYTPISIALILGILLLPVLVKRLKRYALLGGSAISVAAFFVFELLLENKVVVTTAETAAKLEDWQMYMCYIPPESLQTTYKTQTAVDILIGEYNPAFKMHFYIISVVLIIAILNCFYGFARVIKTGDRKPLKSLILQSVSTGLFLGLCILACFTAFWRDGNIRVSLLSAVLMAAFFIIFGITVGIFVGSFTLGKNKVVSLFIPAVASSVMTLMMYIGEMILLNGHVYQLGDGFLFKSLPGIVLAPVDIIIILASGIITVFLMRLANYKKQDKSAE